MTAMATVRISPLTCHGLGLQLAGNTVLSDIDLRVVAGETLGIVGPNGSGKSSLLKLLAGLRTPACGSVQLLGEPLAQMPRRRVAQALALVEQQADTLDAISVFDAVALGRTPWLSALAPFSRQDCAIVEQALADLDALHLRTRQWGSLSGGERQRVHIARALAQRPQVLLLDEPTASLDDMTERKLLDNLERFCQGRTLVIATHRLSVLQRVDRILVLDAGRIVIDDARDAALAKLQGAQA